LKKDIDKQHLVTRLRSIADDIESCIDEDS
jgi:hypothetical protein